MALKLKFTDAARPRSSSSPTPLVRRLLTLVNVRPVILSSQCSTTRSIDPNNTASDVWADSAYRWSENERFLERFGKVSRIHRRKPKGKPMSRRTARANAAKSSIRAAVEHPFAHQKTVMKLVIRTVGLARTEAAIILANMSYNMKRWCWLHRVAATA